MNHAAHLDTYPASAYASWGRRRQGNRQRVNRDPRWRVLMLRTFDFTVKGAANKSAQGIALGGVGIAVRVALGAGLRTPPACPTARSPALIADPGFRGVRAC